MSSDGGWIVYLLSLDTDQQTRQHACSLSVHWHQAITITACIAQSVHSVTARKRQFKRELMLVGVVEHQPCLIHLYFVQTLLCRLGIDAICCLIDVSPWLCLEKYFTVQSVYIGDGSSDYIMRVGIRKEIMNSSTLNRAVRLDSKSVMI